jgi:NAD(P)H-flavin reductase
LENPYLPYPVRVDDVITETEDRNLKTFKFVFINPEDEEKFSYTPGQFAELSVPGKGEIPIGIASSPTEKGFVTFTINKVASGQLVSLGRDGREECGDYWRWICLYHPEIQYCVYA